MPNAVRLTTAVLAGAALGLTACAAPAPGGPASSPTSTGATTAPTTSSATSSTPSATTSAASPTSSRPPGNPLDACAGTTLQGMDASARVGQLLMVGLDTNAAASSLDDELRDHHVGSVILLGGWPGRDKITAATKHLNDVGSSKIGLLIAADQEGGEVQQLRGDFTKLPSALVQGGWSASELTRRATELAKDLRSVGINVNLAPVADTVPAGLGKANEPIGKWGRQFSSDPAVNGRQSVAFIKGMHAGGVAATAKHFPGIGRITKNTDFNATGITDGVTTADDAYLRPFADAIKGGTDLIMVGSAIYSKIDPGVNAMFSRRIVTDTLRTRLGWDGVVITDDVGFAKAVTAVPNAERAVRFVAAGGDIVLTADPADIRPMHAALVAKAKADPAFDTLVNDAAERVLRLKAKSGLLACG